MLNRKNVGIPKIEDINNIGNDQILLLKKMGICYLRTARIPDDFNIKFKELKSDIASFFNQHDEKKNQCSISKYRKTPGGRPISGYNDRRSNIEHLEIFHQTIGKEVNPLLEKKEELINQYQQLFINTLALKLLEKLIDTVQCETGKRDHILQIIDHLDVVLSFLFYPQRTLLERSMTTRPRFSAHRDKDLITLVMPDKPGLKFWSDGRWHDVLPEPGYCVLLIGDRLQYLSQGQIQSCLHMVNTPHNEARLSVVTFISSTRYTPLHLNVEDHSIGANDPNLKQRLNEHDFTDRIAFKGFFSKLRNKFNFYHLLFLSTFLVRDSLVSSRETGILTYGYNSTKWSLISLALTNILMQTLRMTYFETMLLDYLHHFDYPHYSENEQKLAYKLGQSSLSFYGAIKSFTSTSAITHSSFWRAGAARACIEMEKSSSSPSTLNNK